MRPPAEARLESEAGVLTRAVARAAADLALRHKALARVLGVSEASVSRLGTGRVIDPATKEGELAILLVRIYRSLDALVGGNGEQARAWLHAPNHHLHGTPAEMIQSVTGVIRVAEYLDAMRGKS